MLFPGRNKMNHVVQGRDGFQSEDFHAKCDNIPRTVVVVKSKSGAIFGGFTSATWDSHSKYKNDPSAFLFSLVNLYETPVKIRVNGSGVNAIYCSSECGPTFGGGANLCIASRSNVTLNSYSNLGQSYLHLAYRYGSSEAKLLFAGAYKFQVNEIEVFLISNLISIFL
jgi:hypothetical protein